jgi:hypothetical protein
VVEIHIPIYLLIIKFLEALYINRLNAYWVSFFTHRSGEEPNFTSFY